VGGAEAHAAGDGEVADVGTTGGIVGGGRQSYGASTRGPITALVVGGVVVAVVLGESAFLRYGARPYLEKALAAEVRRAAG
jgi:hypothetical protein